MSSRIRLASATTESLNHAENTLIASANNRMGLVMRTRLTPAAIRAVSSLRRASTPSENTVASMSDVGRMYVRIDGTV